jgi:hypothetical protein
MWFGSIAAVLTFVPLFFAEDIEDWRLHQRGIYITRCGPDDFSEMRAGVWTFVAFASVFTPTLLLSAGRSRRDVFERGVDHAA